MPKHATVLRCACVLAACTIVGGSEHAAVAQDETKEAPSDLPPQTVLLPGLYLFQTHYDALLKPLS